MGEIGEFTQIILTNDGSAKPIRIITCNEKIDCAIEQFIQNNLDAIFVATNAPGRNAVNRVERSMAPLSKELAGLILPRDNFGSHLDRQGKTVDPDLERQNVGHAGKVLTEVWSNTTIDGYPFVARYADGSAVVLTKQGALWKMKHVRESQYMVHVVKCSDRACCTKSTVKLLTHKGRVPL